MHLVLALQVNKSKVLSIFVFLTHICCVLKVTILAIVVPDNKISPIIVDESLQGTYGMILCT